MEYDLIHDLRLDLLLHLCLAVALGGAIGLERELQHKAAGLRTNILICVGAVLFTELSMAMSSTSGDPARIAAQIVTGVGFLGAGTIHSGTWYRNRSYYGSHDVVSCRHWHGDRVRSVVGGDGRDAPGVAGVEFAEADRASHRSTIPPVGRCRMTTFCEPHSGIFALENTYLRMGH